MVKVKLCGMKRACDITWANEYMPDYVGFVFAGQRRRITDEQAVFLRSRLDARIQAVGVFVDASQERIAALVQNGVIQLVQLHGHEDETYIKKLRRRIAVPIIQAFSVASRRDAERAQQSAADYILLDHGAGGTGSSFNWSVLRGLQRDYFLAGGLSPENAAQALRLRPYALDVSSGIESEGVKDREKIKQFMAQVRQTVHQEE